MPQPGAPVFAATESAEEPPYRGNTTPAGRVGVRRQHPFDVVATRRVLCDRHDRGLALAAGAGAAIGALLGADALPGLPGRSGATAKG